MPRQRETRRAEPIDRLRDEVRLLGELVGEVLCEQSGVSLFRAVEYVRTAAIDLRSSDRPDPKQERALLRWAQRQSTERLLQLARAFSVYFHLINLAEQHHRVRTLAEREQRGESLHESISAAVAQLRGEGVPAGELLEGLRRLEVHPVFTAHPSEARRRTLLQHLEDVAALIAQLDDPRLPPQRRAATLEELRTRITLIWQTAEARIERPSVLDEVQSALYFLAGTVYDVAPAVWRALDSALADHREARPDPADGAEGEPPTPAPATAAPVLLRFGSWVG